MNRTKTFTFLSPLLRRGWGRLLAFYIRFKGSPVFLNKAIRRAKKLNAKTGKRYRVFFIKNRYEALTREDIQRRKHSKEWGWHVNSTNMQPHCFFDTNHPSFGGAGGGLS